MTENSIARPPSPPRPSQGASYAVKKKRPISSVLGIEHYGSDEESDDNTQDTLETVDGFDSSSSHKRQTRVRFADPELLTTFITYDSSEPIDPDAAVEDEEEDPALENNVNQITNSSWILGGVKQHLMDQQAQKDQIDQEDVQPAPAASFSFAKVVTTTTKRAAHVTTHQKAEGSGGQWAQLTDSAEDTSSAMEWFCDVCMGTIEAHETRYDCRECAAEEWCCCEDCQPDHTHIHQLEPTKSPTHISISSAA